MENEEKKQDFTGEEMDKDSGALKKSSPKKSDLNCTVISAPLAVNLSVNPL